MTITIGMWGVGITVMELVIHLYLGDIYIRVPWVGELAWNKIGFFMDRPQSKNLVPLEFRFDGDGDE